MRKLSTSLRFLFIYRSINWLSLVGNIGGFIGICLGYCLLQLPDFICKIARPAVKHFKSEKEIGKKTKKEKLIRASIEK